jgi:hypothetical protein
MASKTEVATTTKEEPPRVRGGGFEWHTRQGINKDQWLGVVEGDLPPRIKQLDKVTFACYRDGKYLGCEKTLEEAFNRIKENKISEKNRVMELWQKQHPDELPPGLQLSPAERREYWRHNPPGPRASGPATTRTRSRGAEEDPGTVRLRAELAAEAGNRPAAGRTKAASGAAEDPVGVIRVRAGAAIPKKPGSAAHVRWALLWSHDGKQVAEYKRAKGNMTTLANAMAKKLVTVE